MISLNLAIPLFIHLKNCSSLPHSKGTCGSLKDTELRKESWMDPWKFNIALKTDIHSFHQYFLSTPVPGTFTQVLGIY